MGIIHKQGDVFTTDLPAVAHGVNTQGVMGAGVAKTVRARFPRTYTVYRRHCHATTLRPGMMLPIQENGTWVFNLASQDLPGAHARIDWLAKALDKAAWFCEQRGISGFASPQIGAGIGGLVWDDVYAEYERVAEKYPNVDIEVWEYVP